MTLTQDPERTTGVRTAIEFSGVVKTFDPAAGPVLAGLDLKVADGEFVSLVGASGCGKSTLLRLAGDLTSPSEGVVLVDGREAAVARERRDIGIVFQSPNLLAWRSVLRNVELPLERTGASRAERRERAMAQLELVGLADAAGKYPHQISGGMAQRVAIARALVYDPRIVLMDEPFGALDEITRDRLNLEVRDLWARTGKTVLFVTHSVPEAVFMSTRVVVMDRNPGRIGEIVDLDLPAARTADTTATPEFFDAVTRVRASLAAHMGAL
ncbi:ABC transporter ATP-binding protein [Pseudonocardia ailaonensis]|uniref:ABC transporter ATP-binding protein n=1 Tax=Pseudonocardia ailaonensis TaxID=367279 RepID=A0ABN2N4G7_9PSEU